MVSFFPGRTIANLDERKERITVRHLTGMVNGFVSGCLSGDLPTIQKMIMQPDWVQAALDREMAHEPGTVFCYDSPGMHLLSAILQEATGMTALEFARQTCSSRGHPGGDLIRPSYHARWGIALKHARR
jgi:CubicO group peptidase (beta-lactamase class C family)